MEQTRRVFTVRPNGEQWLLCESGDEKSQAFASRDEAVEAGKTLAQGNGPALLKVLDTDGTVQSEANYERDPLVTQLEKFGF